MTVTRLLPLRGRPLHLDRLGRSLFGQLKHVAFLVYVNPFIGIDLGERAAQHGSGFGLVGLTAGYHSLTNVWACPCNTSYWVMTQRKLFL